MSQLDSITWFPQVLWLFIIFFIIYALLYKDYGPLSFYAQGLRNLKIKNHLNSIVSYDYMNIEVIFKRWSLIKLSVLSI